MFKYSVKQKITFFIFLFFIVISFLLVASINNQQKVYRSKAFESQSITPSPSSSASTPAQPASQDQETEEVKKIKAEIEELNNSLLSYLNEYANNKQESLLSLIKEKTQIRKEKLLALLDNNFNSKTYNPKALYEKAFNQETIDKFPQVIKENYLEQRVSFTGIVNTYIFDDFENKRSKTISTIIPENSQDEELQFYPADIFSSFLSGTKVKIDQAVKIKEEREEEVKGVESPNIDDIDINQINNEKIKTLENDELAEAKAKVVAVSITTIQTPPLETLGKQKVFVFLAKLPNVDESLLPAPQEIKDRLNSRINEFYEKNSYGKFSLNTEVVNNKWYQFNNPPIKPTKSWKSAIYEFYDEYFYRKILKQAHQDGVDLKQYDNGRLLLIVAGAGLYDLTNVGGSSSLGKNTNINLIYTDNKKEEIQLKVSRAIIYLGIETLDSANKLSHFHEDMFAYRDENYDKVSNFDRITIHELGHGLGAKHATDVDCKDNTLFSLPYNILPEYRTITNDGEICGYQEYGMDDVMGSNTGSFNAYIKTHFGWLEPIKIDIKKPDGDYTLKPLGEDNAIAVWLPFRTENLTNKVSPRDYFLEYRRGFSHADILINRLVINLEHIDARESDDYGLRRVLKFSATDDNGQLTGGYSEGQIFSDVPNNLQIKVKKINNEEKTLTVNIHSCAKLTDNPFNIELFQAGNRFGNDAVFGYPNVFENDIHKNKGTLLIQSTFFIENKSDCFDVDYNIRDITVDNESTQISEVNINKNAIKIAPRNKEQLLINALVSLKSPTSNNSCINIIAEAQDQYLPFLASGKGIKQMSFCLNLVSSFEEYKNDFEPSWIYITEDAKENCNKSYANRKEINNLTIKKGQNICFRSVVKNNSKNNKVGITSPNFPVVWKIADKEGKDIIKPAFGIHESIPASEAKESDVSNFSWTVPDSIIFGDYKVVYNVNSNRSIEEFNKNNNTVFRDFTVVEK